MPRDITDRDADIAALVAARDAWARMPIARRIEILAEIKALTAQHAERWVEISCETKQISARANVAGEEWLTGPYTLIRAVDALIETLVGLEGRRYLSAFPQRVLPGGPLAVKILPKTVWDRLLFSGFRGEVWMAPEVTKEALPATAARAYDIPESAREGKVALVLGAGNFASIPPLDCLLKLFHEHQVVLLKMNPVNAALAPIFRDVLAPLIRCDALRVTLGDSAAGADLTTHPAIDELHMTGSLATHDAIMWGIGADAAARKSRGTPLNPRRMTSELGAVCPTIVVPGPWSAADICFQAEHIATQKLVNGGYACAACQALIVPGDWSQTGSLIAALKQVIAQNSRPGFYPGTEARLSAFAGHGAHEIIARGSAPDFVLGQGADGPRGQDEVFAPALAIEALPGAGEAYLRAAIAFANEKLHGTLGANILIHPATIRALGQARFEALLGELRYGNIAVNAWTGMSFVLPHVVWGAFPGHTLAHAQSGIGAAHNALMFEKAERSVVTGPWAPFPRSLRHGPSLMPKPAWFVTHRRTREVGRALTRFGAKPGLGPLLRVIWHALRG